MIALVDVDNIPLLERNRGLVHIATRLAAAIGSASLASSAPLRLRLYGGWFNGVNLSRAAQQLVPAVRGDFPRPLTVSDSAGSVTVLARAEFAYSLACDPSTTLTHTYRWRSLPPNLNCLAVPFGGCANPTGCPIQGLNAFINTGQCPGAACSVAPEAVLTRSEQKLVDAMMIVDLIHLAQTQNDSLALVSTDDDLWPGIRLALLHGATLIHVHPVAGRTSPAQYLPLTTSRYSQVTL